MGYPEYNIQHYVHPDSGDTIVGLSCSCNPLLNDLFYLDDAIFGRVATKLPLSDPKMMRLALSPNRYDLVAEDDLSCGRAAGGEASGRDVK